MPLFPGQHYFQQEGPVLYPGLFPNISVPFNNHPLNPGSINSSLAQRTQQPTFCISFRPPSFTLPLDHKLSLLRELWRVLPRSHTDAYVNPDLVAGRNKYNCTGLRDPVYYPLLFSTITGLDGRDYSAPFRTFPDKTLSGWTPDYLNKESPANPDLGPHDRVDGMWNDLPRLFDELVFLLASMLEHEASSHELQALHSLYSSNGPEPQIKINHYFLRYLPFLLTQEHQLEALEESIKTLTLFCRGLSAIKVDILAEFDSKTAMRFHDRNSNYFNALGQALEVLRVNLLENNSQLQVLKSVRIIFNLVFSLNRREKLENCRTLDGSQKEDPKEHYSHKFISTSSRMHTNDNSLIEEFSFEAQRINEKWKAGHRNPNPSSILPAPSCSPGTPVNSVNSNDEFIAQEELVFLERRLSKRDDRSLVIMFQSNMVPMTPVVARDNGRYVRGTERIELSIMDAAYAHELAAGCLIPCEFVLNPTYTPDTANISQIPRLLTYVGFVYPDNTMLSYIPIKKVTIVYENSRKRQPLLMTGSTMFAFLHMDISNVIYQNLKMLAKTAFLREHPDTQFVDHFEELQDDGKMRIEILVKSERTVRIEDGTRYRDYPVLQALFFCQHDLSGKALMHLRFTSTKRGSQKMQLRVILFGITVERSRYNFNHSIFDLLNSPVGPIEIQT